MERLFNSVKIAELLKKPAPVRRTIEIPRKGDLPTHKWHDILFKLEGVQLRKLRIYWGKKESGLLLDMLDKMGKKNMLSISELDNYY